MDTNWTIVIALGLVSLLISIVIIPTATILSNFTPRSFFVKIQLDIIGHAFSTDLAKVYLACCYRCRFFYLNAILIELGFSVVLNWVFFAVYYFVVSSTRENINYLSLTPNKVFLGITFLLNGIDIAFSGIMYLLLKKYRVMYKFTNLEKAFDNLIDADFTEIKFLSGENQTKLFKDPINNFINSMKIIYHTDANKINDRQIIKCLWKTIFLFMRNTKYAQTFDKYVLFTSVKINNLSDPITSLKFLKIINDYLLACASIIQNDNKKERIGKLLSKMSIRL